jgi:diguanylate cyclase (GGDEF)-like protein
MDTVIRQIGHSSGNADKDASLIFIYPTGPGIGRRHVLGEYTLILGRGEDCDLQVRDNSVSRRHARIDRSAQGYTILDMKSSNGTYINNVQVSVEKPSLLQDGDYLRIGDCIFRFLSSGNVEAEYHEEIYRLTILDPLTQIHNKRYLLEFLDREVLRTVRHSRPLSLVMFDLDYFKSINDQHGHLAGDYVLREVASCVQKAVRREDLLARYGGEEFAMVLVETRLKEAIHVAERIRGMVQKYHFQFESKQLSPTISLGVAECPLDSHGSVNALIQKADENLYKAKQNGRNRVVG